VRATDRDRVSAQPEAARRAAGQAGRDGNRTGRDRMLAIGEAVFAEVPLAGAAIWLAVALTRKESGLAYLGHVLPRG
jgi:hypothetical protein